MLATLLNPPTDPVSLLVFSFANADLHRRTNEAIFTALGLQLQNFLLDPIGDMKNWLTSHQESHWQINGALGISSNDLTSVDLEDAGQLASWIRIHFSEHNQASLITGVV